MKLREWNARLHGLVIFRSLLDDPVVAKLVDLTDRMEAGAPGCGPVCDAVAQFEAALFEHTTNWGSYLSAAVLEAETVCVRQAASGTLAPALQTALDSELAFLQALCGLTLDELLAHLHGPRSWHVRVLAREFFSPAGFVDPFLQEKVHPKARLLRGLLSEITGIPQEASQLDCCIASSMGTCMMLIMLDPAFANSLFPNLAEKSASLDQMVKDFIFAGLDDAAAKWRARSAGAGCGTGSGERR